MAKKSKVPLTAREMKMCAAICTEAQNMYLVDDVKEIPSLMKQYGMESVLKAWTFVKSKNEIGNVIKYLKKAIKEGWSIEEGKSKMICLAFSREFPSECVMNKKHLSLLQSKIDIYFSLPVEEVSYVLDREAARLKGDACN